MGNEHSHFSAVRRRLGLTSHATFPPLRPMVKFISVESRPKTACEKECTALLVQFHAIHADQQAHVRRIATDLYCYDSAMTGGRRL